MDKRRIIFLFLFALVLTPLLAAENSYTLNNFGYNTRPGTLVLDANQSSVNVNHSNFADLAQDSLLFDSYSITSYRTWLESWFCKLTGCTMAGDINMSGNNIDNVGHVQFDTAGNGCVDEGCLEWNPIDGTLDLTMPGGSVNQQIGLENLRRVKANETIYNGDIVYPCGGTANRLLVCRADNGEIATAGVSGIATEDIIINQFGYVNAFGYVRNISTIGYYSLCSEGSPAWLSSNGTFQCIPPSADKIKTIVGVIVSAHATNGIIDTDVQIVPRLQGLSQVNGTNLNSEHILIYNSTSGIWENRYRPNWENLSYNEHIDGSVVGLMMTNPPNKELPHLYIQSGGAGQFSGMVRSWGIVDEQVNFLDSTNRTDCQAYFDVIGEELKIDCNTTTTGADFFVSDDSQFVDEVWMTDTDDEWHFMTRELELLDENKENTVQSRLNNSIIGNNFTLIEAHGKNIVVTLHENTEILDKTSDSILLNEGTNSTPIFNHIYYDNGNQTILKKSTTQEDNVGDVAMVMLGSGFDYGSIGGSANQYEFTRNNYFNSWYRGEVYQNGFDIAVGSSSINISTGSMWLLLDSKTTTKNHSTEIRVININSTGQFNQINDLNSAGTYNTGEIISNNKYFNVVCGIANTVGSEGVMYCMPQNKPVLEHAKQIDAETDNQYIAYYPNHDFIKRLYTPVVRVVMQRVGGTNVIKELTTFDGYYIDLRGVSLGTGGSSPSAGITSLSQLDIDTNYIGTGYNITSDYFIGDGSLLTGLGSTYNSSYIPYTGANTNINLGSNNLIVDTDTLFVDSVNNRVGIGTTSPDATLDVNGAAILRGGVTTGGNIELTSLTSGDRYSYIDFHGDDTYTDYSLRIIRNNIGANADSIITHRGTGSLKLITQEAGDIIFHTNNTERMKIDSSGNVGIGTTSPTANLEVNGGIKMSSSTDCLMMRDTDNAGWTKCTTLNGVMSCSIDADGIC